MLPFLRPVPEDEKVEGLDKPEYWGRLGELPGIFNWACEGLRRLRGRGKFATAAASAEAVSAYRAECDPEGTFHGVRTGTLVPLSLSEDEQEALLQLLEDLTDPAAGPARP